MVVDATGGKTPVSLLQEICTRKNITPKYELLQVEGAVHEPTFQYRLSLEWNGQELEQTGTGRSKKEAKHNTAFAMLVAMGLLPKDTVFERQKSRTQLQDIGNAVESDLAGNPVGLLQELCMKMKYPPPVYEVHSEEGLPHERVFAMACRVGEQFVEVGRGKSKKLAKREAAALMAERLRNIPQEPAAGYEWEEDDDRIFERLAGSSKVEGNGGGNGDREDDKEQKQLNDGTLVSKMQRMIRNQLGDSKISERLPEIMEHPIKFLREVEYNSFKAIFVEFDEVSTESKYQCLVQMTTDPPIVGIGEGVTPKEAKESAARDAVFIFAKLLDDPT